MTVTENSSGVRAPGVLAALVDQEAIADVAGRAQLVAQAREDTYEAYLSACNTEAWCFVAGWAFGAVLRALGGLS